MQCLRTNCTWAAFTFRLLWDCSFQIVFEGTVGNGVAADIAIDNFRIYDRPCPPPGDCDFEQLCTWHNTKIGDDFDWVQGAGSTNGLQNSGPQFDHTTKSEKGILGFLLVDSVQTEEKIVALVYLVKKPEMQFTRNKTGFFKTWPLNIMRFWWSNITFLQRYCQNSSKLKVNAWLQLYRNLRCMFLAFLKVVITTSDRTVFTWMARKRDWCPSGLNQHPVLEDVWLSIITCTATAWECSTCA